MPETPSSELQLMSESLAHTIKNRQAMVDVAPDDESKAIHKQQLAKYKAQKSEVDSKISASTNPIK